MKTKTMRRTWYKQFIMQVIISLLYLGITCYQFVKDEFPNPIGVGLRQWLLFIIHILFVVIWYFIKRRVPSHGHIARQILLINILGIIVPFGVYLLFGSAVWNWLWSIR